MANLVDDFKNMMPGGVRIRKDVVTIPNGENGIESLDLFEGVICERTNIPSSGSNSNLFFTSNVTIDVFEFKIPMGDTISDSASSYVDNYSWNVYTNLVNTNRISLYPIVLSNGKFLVNMRWLVLRIA